MALLKLSDLIRAVIRLWHHRHYTPHLVAVLESH